MMPTYLHGASGQRKWKRGKWRHATPQSCRAELEAGKGQLANRQSPGVKFAKMAKVDSCVCKVVPYPAGGQCLTTGAQRTRRDEMRPTDERLPGN